MFEEISIIISGNFIGHLPFNEAQEAIKEITHNVTVDAEGVDIVGQIERTENDLPAERPKLLLGHPHETLLRRHTVVP